jgi:putative effector of murein hydrolase
MGLPTQLALALAPRSVTVALALPIAALLGAGSDASVTAAAAVLTGLIGANFAQPLLTALGFRDPIVRGLSTAASAHGLGTAALAAKEPEALPMAALAYATMGIVSSVLVAVPQFRALIMFLAGA